MNTNVRVSVLALCALAVATASGGTTAVNTTGANGEQTVPQILNTVYGGVFAGSIGTSLTNGTVTATRLNDFMTGPLDAGANRLQLATAVGDSDQIWEDGTVTFVAEARFAGYGQYFGYRNGIAGGAPTASVAITGSGYGVSTATNGPWSVGPGDFHFLRAGNATFTPDANNGDVYSSIADNNADDTDHMIAFKIEGLSGLRYMLFWEDLPLSGGLPGDYDYNDLAMELRVVPLPTGVALAGAGLALAAWRRRR